MAVVVLGLAATLAKAENIRCLRVFQGQSLTRLCVFACPRQCVDDFGDPPDGVMRCQSNSSGLRHHEPMLPSLEKPKAVGNQARRVPENVIVSLP
jgi:hypothetical protein